MIDGRAPARILGIDPGSTRTGWGLIQGDPCRPELVDSGVIELGRGAFSSRLARLRAEIDRLVERLEPRLAAVETPFHGVSARSALQLAHARGVILAGLSIGGVEVAEYAPAAIKLSVVGHGRADKAQVRTMVLRLVHGAKPTTRHEDETDAVAVAVCHAAHLPGLRMRQGASARR